MADNRDERVSEVLEGALRGAGLAGRWLVADDRPGRAGAALREDGAPVETWFRQALGSREATATPPDGPFDGIVARLPRGTDALRMTAHLLTARLASDGVLVLAGGTDEGSRPAARRLAAVLAADEEIDARRHCRVVRGRVPRADLSGSLEDWRSEVHAEVSGVSLAWSSWPSMFAHGRLDPGTGVLLRTLPPLEGRVLDFACGAGVIAQFLARRGDPVTLEVSDVDALALHATAESLPTVPRHLSDGLPAEGGPWDVIVSNPPLHLGKDESRSTLHALAATAPHRLRRGGALWIVVQGAVPVVKLLGASFPRVDRVARDARYAVWRAST